MQCPGNFGEDSVRQSEDSEELNGLSSVRGVSISYSGDGALVLSDHVASSGRSAGENTDIPFTLLRVRTDITRWQNTWILV